MVVGWAMLTACGSDSPASSEAGAAPITTPTTTVTTGATAPTPMPTPPAATTVLAASLLGEADILDNFDPTSWLVTGEQPHPSGSPGAFRFTCAAGHLSRNDPIVYPGQPGKSHLHQFFGNTGTDANSTYQSLRTTGGSTCTRSTGDSPQRSAYWMPAMLDGVGNVVKPDWMNTYYKQLPASDPECANTVVSLTDYVHPGAAIGRCIPIPNGIRFILGYDMTTMKGGPADLNSRDSAAMGFDCMRKSDQYSYTGLKRTMADMVADGRCPVGAWLRAYLTFPSCWDGKSLDSPNHRDHIVFPPQSRCPQSHPYKIPEVAISAFFTVDANFLAGKWRLASDEMMPGAVPGSTLHMDYWEAWSPAIKAIWQSTLR